MTEDISETIAFQTMLEEIENKGWNWLVRSNRNNTDRGRGYYFANITKGEVGNLMTFPAYGITKERALRAAFTNWKEMTQ